MTLEEQIIRLSELAPIAVIGFFMGVATLFAQHDDKNKKRYKGKGILVYNIITSIVLATATFAIVGLVTQDYIVRMGLGCAVSFFGIEKMIDLFRDFMGAKSGRSRRERRYDDDIPPR